MVPSGIRNGTYGNDRDATKHAWDAWRNARDANKHGWDAGRNARDANKYGWDARQHEHGPNEWHGRNEWNSPDGPPFNVASWDVHLWRITTIDGPFLL